MAAAATATDPMKAHVLLHIRQFSFMAGGCQLRLFRGAGRFAGEETADVLVEKRAVGRVSARACRVSPQRWNRDERDTWDELRLEPRVANREVEVGLRRHVEHRYGDRAERPLHVAVEAGRRADVVALPRARLQNQIVGVVVLKERPPPGVDFLL